MAVLKVLGTCISLLSLLEGAFAAHSNHVHHSRQAAVQGKDRWEQLHQDYLETSRSSLEPDGECTWDSMVVRKEWGDMSIDARKEYISAIQCLAEKPSQTNQTEFPGARTRWDDLAVGHVLNVQNVHRSPWLAVWHRHYVWLLEQMLREECGYTHGLPYWHWSRYLDQDISTWPLFDGSETSISGNGTQTGPQCACIEDGPFANFSIHLGPQGEDTWGCKRNPRTDGRGYNTGCIERTFNLDALSSTRYEDVVYTVDQAPDANAFASLLELQAPSVHNAPHLFMGGTQIDVTFSAQDPWFFFHHAMVDFLFAVWQSVDLDKRTTTLPDARIFDEMRAQGWSLPTPEVDLDSEIFTSPVFRNITAREAMWTVKNRYCYRYE